MGLHKQRIKAFQAVYMYGLNTYRKKLLDEDEIRKHFLSPPDMVAIELFNCVVENQQGIDFIINENATNVDLKSLSWVLRAILRLSIAELFFLPQPTEKPLVIDEAIILAKTYGESNSFRLINAILDKIKT